MKFNSIASKLFPFDELIGVDVNVRRMHTCKALVRKQLPLLPAPPHCTLVVADGVQFSGLDISLNKIDSAVIFDSELYLEEVKEMAKMGRKRENKSSKGRERKRLKEKFTELLPSYPSSLASSYVISPSSHLYDRVLVDAECSHDGSYRHISAMATKANAMEIYHATDRDIHMTTLQIKLLQNGFNLLQPNGILIYSTCRSQ